jgi:hypothetical protein
MDHAAIGLDGQVLGVVVDLKEQDIPGLRLPCRDPHKVFIEQLEERRRMRAVRIIPDVLIAKADDVFQHAPDQAGAIATHALLMPLVAEAGTEPTTSFNNNFVL